MENYAVKNINNDFLLQSYSQSVERITGTKDHIFNFQLPKELLKVREKAWINLFNKYSKEMSDDIELNVDTLEDEEETEKEVCEEEYSCEQRIPMRKPATLIQYWINTGNQPYKALLDENELSEIGTSLSEKEITLSLHSSVSNIINEDNEQEYKSESSCSSVNTAAYILSNTNITNKADTIAIRESANGKNINSSKNIKDIELCSTSKEYIALKTCDRSTANIITSDNTTKPNMYSWSCEQIDKMNMLNIPERSLNIQSRDNIVQQFDEISKRLTGDDKNNDASNQDEMLKEDIEKEVSRNIIAQEIITKDMNLTASYRKKLYTDRNSPVDLTQTERYSIGKLSGAKERLHPALDSDCTINKETLLVHKDKSTNLSPGKTNLSFKKKKRKKRKLFSFNKNITDTNNHELSNDDRIQNHINDNSFKITSNCNNSDKQDDILLSEHNNANTFIRSETCKLDLASLNINILNPVVLLERIAPVFKRHESKSVENNHISNIYNYRHLNKSSKLYTCEVENVELETIDSDESTILVCQCKTNAQHSASFSKTSDYPLHSRLSIEDDFSVLNTEEEDLKLSNLKNTDVNQNKESYTILEEFPSHLSINENCTNVRDIKVTVTRLPSSAMKSQISNKNDTVQRKNVSNKPEILSSKSDVANKVCNARSREIKVILERLPALVNKNSTNITMETEILNENDIQQEEILNKFKTHSSNPYKINKKDTVKLREIKIALKRLPSNICLNNTNIFTDKNIISENTNVYNNKEYQIEKMFKISACENVEASIQTVDKVDNNYSFRMHTKSKKCNDTRISDTSDIVAEHQVFDKIESEFPIQYKNDSKMSQDNCSKYSILTFSSSDEDDFVQLIQRPKKRLKLSINDKLDELITEKNLCDKTKFVATDKDKYHNNRNSKTVIFSSKEPKTKEIFQSKFEIKERKGSNGIEIKSCDNTTASLKMCKKAKSLFTSNQNGDIPKNLDKSKKRASFLNYNKNINNSNERHSNTIMKTNEIDYKDDTCNIFFQTKTFYSDSSDSEESNSYTASTRKTFKNSFIHHKSQYHNHANLEKFFNDSNARRYKTDRKHSSSLNSSFEKHDVANRIYNTKIGLESISKEAKINKRLNNDEEFNDNINSTINIKQNISSFINDKSIQDTIMQKTMLSSISPGKNNFSSLTKNISDKSKNSSSIQQDDVKSTKLFQTKTYYNSDSNESL